MRILIAEDDTDIRSYLVAVCEAFGHSVTECDTGPSAWREFEREPYDIVILDRMMPGFEGLEVCRRIRESRSNTYIIAITGLDKDHEVAAGLDAGVDDYINKPVSEKLLRNRLLIAQQRILERHSLATAQRNERRAQQKATNQRNALHEHAVVLMTDKEGRATFANHLFCQLTGYEESAIHRQRYVGFFGTPDLNDMDELDSSLRQGKQWRGELQGTAQSGEIYWLDASIVPFFDEDGKLDQYVWVGTDVTGIKESESALAEAKEVAEEANKAKSEFLSSMSHELRTPLNGILGFSQLLQTDPRDPLSQSQSGTVDRIVKAGNHLLSLINDILDLAKIEAGKFSLSMECVGLSGVIDDALNNILPMAEEKGIQVLNAIEGLGKVHVHADYTRLKQVVLNLLSNAVKYNQDKGKISLDYTRAPEGMVAFSISDTGHGIPKEQLDKLFEPFNRLAAEHTSVQGTGIGLSITKQLVEMMGGTLRVESTVGEGSRFTVSLEMSEASDANEEMMASTIAVPEEPVKAEDEKKTILYVEDNPNNVELVKLTLRRRPNVTLEVATEATTGLQMAQTIKPDLILMDINLPGMNGFEAMEALRQNDLTSNIPVLALSANAMPRDIERGKNAGFQDYLTKPINIAVLLEKVDEYLNYVPTNTP